MHLPVRTRCTLVLFLLCALPGLAAGSSAKSGARRGSAGSAAFAPIDRIVNAAIDAHQIPGAVVYVGHNGRLVFHRAYGERSLEPAREPMTEDTIFDMASLTKPLATATSLMILYQQGRFRLNDPVSKYLPEFAVHDKQDITIRQLLTHYSGLPPDVDLKAPWRGKEAGLNLAFNSGLDMPPGVHFRYSDINFITLGALVEKLSGMSLADFARQNIYVPLGMTHSRFLPPDSWLPRIAPTQYDDDGRMLRGEVHDPTSRRMGGVTGHAGLFSCAADVAIYAQSMINRLNGGSSKFPLTRITAQKMTTPGQPATATALRGLGWDISSPFSGNRGELLPVGSFGHTGFTGTSLWIDPHSNTYVIILTNRVHPRGGPNIVAVEGAIANAVAEAVGVHADGGAELARITGYEESITGLRRLPARNGAVLTGVDVLEAKNFEPLRPLLAEHGGHLRIGLLTNPSGVDGEGRRTIDVLFRDAPAKLAGLELTTLFSPEHGIAGRADTTDIRNSRDDSTGLPVVSLYGATDAERRPPPEALRQLDAVVIDLQDAGVRFYTYETVVGYFLEAAAKAGVTVVVLDRPNPVGGVMVQGPISDAGQESYTDYMPLPSRHGMTMGELARYFNGERHLDAKLLVVPMEGWRRGDWFDSTGLLWIDPSPNLRNLMEEEIYPGLGLIETSNVSVGRGTDTPFELLGAPWIDARALAKYMNGRYLPGIRFVPTQFTPAAPYPYAGQLCKGLQLTVTDRDALEAPEMGIEVAAALHKLYPEQFHMDAIHRLVVNRQTMDDLKAAKNPQVISSDWDKAIQAFMERRKPYLLY